jgi:hypothetical protein
MIFHDLTSARRLLCFDRIHDRLVRIHDFLDLCERFATSKAGANRRFERCAQRTAENLEQIVTGGIAEQLVKADVNSRETIVVSHVLAHSFHSFSQRFDVSLGSVNRCQLGGVDLDGNPEFQNVFDRCLSRRQRVIEKRE